MKTKMLKVITLAGLMSGASQVGEGLMPHSYASAAMIQQVIRVCRELGPSVIGRPGDDIFEIVIRYGDEGAEALCRCTRDWLEAAGRQTAQGTVTNSAGETVQCVLVR